MKKRIVDFITAIKISFSNKNYRKYAKSEKKKYITTKLNSEQKKKLKEFYKPYFSVDPLYCSYYTEKTGEFFANYIPDDEWFTHIDRHFNNREKARVLDHKSYYSRMFSGTNIKMPHMIAQRINGFWYDEHMNMITKKQVLHLVKEEMSIFVKTSSGSCGGRGVIHISNEERETEKFEKAINNNFDIVVQRGVKQHKELERVGKMAVNTIRILSLLSEEGVKIYSSVLRMGVGNSKVDNASSGGIVCGIDKSGRLKKIAYKINGEKYYKHPNTETYFSEIIIPSFDKATEVVKKLHIMIPDFRLVSWDIAIDEDAEPVLIEANLCLGELDFHQLTNGPVFGEDTEKILNEVYGK